MNTAPAVPAAQKEKEGREARGADPRLTNRLADLLHFRCPLILPSSKHWQRSPSMGPLVEGVQRRRSVDAVHLEDPSAARTLFSRNTPPLYTFQHLNACKSLNRLGHPQIAGSQQVLRHLRRAQIHCNGRRARLAESAQVLDKTMKLCSPLCSSVLLHLHTGGS